MACRDLTKAEIAKSLIEKETEYEKEKGSIIVEHLDLCSLQSVREFVARILASEATIQILINNAGVMMCPESKTKDGFETHIGSNHFAPALLTLLLLPRLIQDGPSRIVFVSSMLHEKYNFDVDDFNFESRPYDAYEAYCRSKAANVLFAKALALKLKEHNINNVTTYSLHPGVISTGIGRHLNTAMWTGASWLFNNVLYWFIKSPRCGAQTSIYCAVDEDCANESGFYYSDCTRKTPSKQCRSDEEASKAWALTTEVLENHLKNHQLSLVRSSM
ncbi:retinol dehydrogenase 13-like [Bombyx mori]